MIFFKPFYDNHMKALHWSLWLRYMLVNSWTTLRTKTGEHKYKKKKIILRISNCKFIVKWTINWQFINLCYKCFSSQCMTIKCIKKKKRKEEEAFFCQNITISTVSQSAIDREVQTSPLNLKTLHLYLSIST